MIAGLALADFRDRVRRPAYAAILLAAAGLGYLATPSGDKQWVILNVGEYRGVYDSGYTGAVTALAGALWLMFGGFYLVRDAIGRDQRSGVGELLAATPVSRAGYLVGKFAGNLLLLASMAVVLAGMALTMQLARGESRAVHPVDLLLPFVLITLPVLAVTAAAAVLFETVRPLRGGFGNIAWFVVWMVLAIAGQSSGAPFGGLGTGYLVDSIRADLRARGAILDSADFGLGFMYVEHPLRTFVWSGLDVNAGFIADRIGLALVALAVAAVPALWFHRFDTARGTATAAPVAPAPPPVTVYTGPPRTAVRRGDPAGRLLVGELRILVQGISLWWWLGAAALVVAGLATPVALVGAWIWPVLVWSRLGTQRAEPGIAALLGAYPAARRRLLAEWVAGVALTALVGAGPAVRMAVTGDAAGLASWAAGALFIPSLALALGVVSRTQRLFQAVYLPLWYLVVNDIAAVDYMGVLRGGPSPVLVTATAAILLTAAGTATALRHARR